MVAFADMLPELDTLGRSAVCRSSSSACITAYDKYEFHGVTYAIHNFCVVDMSNFYLDVIKDRLYCDSAREPLPPQRPDRHLSWCSTR